MARPFQFPNNPGIRRENPFVDSEGKNPFSDSADVVGESSTAESAEKDAASDKPSLPAKDAASDNIFAAPQTVSSSREAVYREGDFEETLPHRAGTVLALGIVGLIGASLGAIGGLASFAGGYGFEQIVFMSGLAPLTFLSLGASLPAFFMSFFDRRAMAAGAMDKSGRPRTNVAFFLSLVAITISLIPVFMVVVGIVLEIIEAAGGL